MELCSIDVSRETVEKCKRFDEKTYETCKKLLPPDRDIYEHTDLLEATESLIKDKLPLYRQVIFIFTDSAYRCFPSLEINSGGGRVKGHYILYRIKFFVCRSIRGFTRRIF